MMLQMSRDALLTPVQQVIGVVERRQTLPILSNLLLQVNDGVMTITANDLEMELVATATVIDGENGQITVPGRKLFDLCRALPETANLEFKVEGDRAVIRSGRSRFSLATLPAENYPTTDEQTTAREFSLPQKLLHGLIERTHFCMAHQDVRHFLNGLLLELGDCRLRAVATDGHRLAMCETQTEIRSDAIEQVIVPRKGVHELLRILSDKEEEVACRLGSNHIQVTLPGIRFTSKLVDGRFPEYERVIPEAGKNRLLAPREPLRQALTRASILSNEKYKGVRFGVKPGRLEIVAQNPEQEEAEEELEVHYEGDALEIGFNVIYILEALASLDGDQVHMWFRDWNSSCLIQETEDARCRYVVMPMRL